MAQRLPPLNALRAFEAAGRHLSFTKAAAELYVTQAAISHQIKGLEDYLGLPLFRRLNRALLLTEEGQHYLTAVSQALDDLRKATEQLFQRDATGILTVSVLPSFAARWLVPRLGRFRQAYPDIEVRIAPSPEVVDFAQGDVDIAIRYGHGSYPGLSCDRFMSEDVFPVCSPELLRGKQPMAKPGDLKYHHLLHDEGLVEWRLWLLAAGVEGIDLNRGTFFTDSSMLVQAAVAGQGVALGRSVLVEDEIAAGRLIRPFSLSLPVEYAYHIVYPETSAERPKIIAFRDWLLQERDRSVKDVR
jgi:LysR family glycine cleavage system transcriptional activator